MKTFTTPYTDELIKGGRLVAASPEYLVEYIGVETGEKYYFTVDQVNEGIVLEVDPQQYDSEAS